MSARVQGKVVLITGAASGIGLESAEICARLGAIVVITGLNVKQGEVQARRLLDEGLAVSFVPQDVTDESDWKCVVDGGYTAK